MSVSTGGAARPAPTLVGRRIVSVDHARDLARRRLPRTVAAFVHGGNEEGLTLADNVRAFREIAFNPSVAIAHPARSLERTVLGSRLSMPVVVAPTGMIRIAHREGEVAIARAAGKAGIATGVSTMSGYPLAEIAAASGGPVWYQLYFVGGRDGTAAAIDLATAAGCTALIVTVDTSATRSNEDVLRRGGLPSRIGFGNVLRYAPECLLHPGWTLGFLRDGLRLRVPNPRLVAGGPELSPAVVSASYRKHPPTWADVAWVKSRFNGKVIVKGVLNAADARLAVEHGADAVVVSNHGGNTLDGAPASLRVLPRIVDAVGSRTEVLLDSGVRRGGDVVKALAMGARAVLVGRAVVWGLAAGGEAGVTDVLEVLREGIDRTLNLLGCAGVDDLGPRYLHVPPEWERAYARAADWIFSPGV